MTQLHRTTPVISAVFWLLLIAMYGMPAICATPDFQYTNVAPLPGGGIAINQQGRIDGQGAMQVNIPIAYTPGWGYVSLGGFEGQHPEQTSKSFDNGSGVLGVGLFENRRVFVSAMQVSNIFSESKCLSAQVSLFNETIATPAISVGIQDIRNKEVDGRSLYVVATKGFLLAGKGAYATLGFGTGRFLDRPFAGISIPLTASLNFAAEWDGFQRNTGIGWKPQGRNGNLTVLGSYNNQTGWLLGGSLAFDLKR